MFDQLLTLTVQHYVLVGVLAISFGVIVNLVFTIRPEDGHSEPPRKLY